MTVGGPAAAYAVGASSSTVTTQHIDQQTVLDPRAVAAALAIRSEETTERSMQRARLGASVLSAEAQKVHGSEASLDALASDRQVRFADAPIVWSLPVTGFVLTSLYGPRWGGMHTGLDMAVPSGTPIYAMADGVVVSTEYSGGYGNRTIVSHKDGTETWYCHQSKFGTTPGAVVKGGELIGYVGSTGNSTGPHLHVEVHPNGGDPINPLTWMRGLGLAV
jgi:murein DD-endopeptidase MepM/ murein hydrolase activator NlpD